MTTIVFNAEEITPAPRRSYLRGMVEAFNLRGATRRNYYFHPTAQEADLAAMQNDWDTVGADLSDAFSFVADK